MAELRIDTSERTVTFNDDIELRTATTSPSVAGRRISMAMRTDSFLEDARKRRRRKRIGAPVVEATLEIEASAPKLSTQLQRYDNSEDATCQVDPMEILGELPSEAAVRSVGGYELRQQMDSIMPALGGNRSITLEQREIERLQSKPSIHELRTMKELDSLRNFQLSVGKKAKRKRKEERAQLSAWQRLSEAVEAVWSRYERVRQNASIPLWRARIKFIESRFGGTFVAYFIFLRWLLFLNTFIGLLLFFLLSVNTIQTVDWSQVRIDFIPFVPAWSGTIDSFFFYGGYPKAGVNNYDTALAYILVPFFVFVISMFVVLNTLRRRFIRHGEFQVTGDTVDGAPYSQLVWTVYDYSLNDEKALRAIRFAISGALKTMMTTENLRKRAPEERSLSQRFLVVLKRVVLNIIVLGLLALEAFLIYFFIQNPSISNVEIPGVSQQIQTTAFLISGLNIVLPMMFSFITQWEGYTDKDLILVLEISRTYLVKMAGIYVLLFGYLHADTDPRFQNGQGWETEVGQQFYNLMWTNTAATVLSTVGVAAGFKYVMKRPWEFSISGNILDLVYSQALVWAGFYFCPVLPLFGVIFSFITFYVKSLCLVYFAEPPSELFSSSRTSKFFFVVLLFTLLVALVPAGYAMTRMVPSSGPHVGQTTAYGLIPQLIDASNEGVRNFFTFIGTPAFIIALLCSLIICLYYVDTMRKKAAKRLREVERELRVEREDKRYLLRFYNLHR